MAMMVTLSDEDVAAAQALVAAGIVPDLAAAVKRGLALLQAEADSQCDADAELRALLAERAAGPFVSAAEWALEKEGLYRAMRGDGAVSNRSVCAVSS